MQEVPAAVGHFDDRGSLAHAAKQGAGGEGGIRTPDTVIRMPHFECGAFNHSATSPSHINRAFPLWCRPSLLPLCYHFSKAMAYRLSRREVNAGGCISLHPWQNVTIEVEGYSHF